MTQTITQLDTLVGIQLVSNVLVLAATSNLSLTHLCQSGAPVLVYTCTVCIVV